MKRLTMYTSSGDLNNIVVVDGKAIEECLEFVEPLQRLAEYEDTGLTPEQIKNMAEAKTTAPDGISKSRVRLTTDKEVSEMSMTELAHNCCYAKDRKARYRDYDDDIDARDMARVLMKKYAKVELSQDDERFDQEMCEYLECGSDICEFIATFYRNIWAQVNLYERLKEYEDLEEQRQWILCSDRMPKNEQNVEITYTRQDYRTGEKQYLTARAFYEDGTLTTENSAYNWSETDNWEYDEQTDLFIIIPEGWYEKVSFTEHFDIVDMPVIAWRPLPEPYKGEETLTKIK